MSAIASTFTDASLNTIRIVPRKIVIENPQTVCFTLREQSGRLSIGVQFNLRPQEASDPQHPWWQNHADSPWIEIAEGDHLRLNFDENQTENVLIYFPIVQKVAGRYQIGCNVRTISSGDNFRPCEHINPDLNFQKTAIPLPKKTDSYIGQRFAISAFNKKFEYQAEPIVAPVYPTTSPSEDDTGPTNVYWLSRSIVIGLQGPPI